MSNQPKYSIGQTVYFFRSGKLVERSINKIVIEITKETFSVYYEVFDFVEGLNMTTGIQAIFYERDLFATKQEFIDSIKFEDEVFIHDEPKELFKGKIKHIKSKKT